MLIFFFLITFHILSKLFLKSTSVSGGIMVDHGSDEKFLKITYTILSP